ncbi:uncharacterized protein LOC131846369 [Achroia grisella]|uniref:uncharacterized protein LOC131846369 n=1 Tax=Achroia grisella TaxID=688607 RepID=UPI0027D268AE|nr:uncharacterized protein LOC131846369 [Achroia grisella]
MSYAIVPGGLALTDDYPVTAFLPLLVVTAQHQVDISELKPPDINSWIGGNDDFYVFHEKNPKELKEIPNWFFDSADKPNRRLPSERNGEKTHSNAQKLTKQDYEKINQLYIDRLKMKPWQKDMKMPTDDPSKVMVTMPQRLHNKEKYSNKNKHHDIESLWNEDINPKHSIWTPKLSGNSLWHTKPSHEDLDASRDSVEDGLESNEIKEKVIGINKNIIEQGVTTEKLLILPKNIKNDISPSMLDNLYENHRETKRPEDVKPVWDVTKQNNEDVWDKASITVNPTWEDNKETELVVPDVTKEPDTDTDVKLDEHESMIKLKLFSLITQTKETIDKKLKGIEVIHHHYKENKYYRIGYITSYLFRSLDLLTDLYKYIERNKNKWNILKILNSYEQIKKADEYLTRTMSVLTDAVINAKKNNIPHNMPQHYTKSYMNKQMPISWSYYDN